MYGIAATCCRWVEGGGGSVVVVVVVVVWVCIVEDADNDDNIVDGTTHISLLYSTTYSSLSPNSSCFAVTGVDKYVPITTLYYSHNTHKS
jgi:hypothetical protein